MDDKVFDGMLSYYMMLIEDMKNDIYNSPYISFDDVEYKSVYGQYTEHKKGKKMRYISREEVMNILENRIRNMKLRKITRKIC